MAIKKNPTPYTDISHSRSRSRLNQDKQYAY